MQRKPWTQQYDFALQELVQQIGHSNWTLIAAQMCKKYPEIYRTGKQCRERWINHLDSTVSKATWTKNEDKIIFQMHTIYGNKWKQIAKSLTARTENDIKNRFYATIRRGVRRLNKLLGFEKNCSELRKIKPKVLTSLIEQEQKLPSDVKKAPQFEGVFNLIVNLSRSEQKDQANEQILENEQLIKAASQFLDRVIQGKQELKGMKCKWKKKNKEEIRIYQWLKEMCNKIASNKKFAIFQSFSASIMIINQIREMVNQGRPNEILEKMIFLPIINKYEKGKNNLICIFSTCLSFHIISNVYFNKANLNIIQFFLPQIYFDQKQAYKISNHTVCLLLALWSFLSYQQSALSYSLTLVGTFTFIVIIWFPLVCPFGRQNPSLLSLNYCPFWHPASIFIFFIYPYMVFIYTQHPRTASIIDIYCYV